MESVKLRDLEEESIYILREVAACYDNPVLMYSIGKDSSVLLHLAQKAFYPADIPFSLLHIDTGWKFKEMISFRDKVVKQLNLKLHVYTNQEGVQNNVTPFTHGSSAYTDIMKTQALRQALDQYQFDCALGGARRDEDLSRAKERIFSIRNKQYSWNPREQRPEFWRNFNTQITDNQTMRVFPISNWTELDVWTYILAENIPVVPLYFAKMRPVVQQESGWMMVDDCRYPLSETDRVQTRKVRFRTLGCYPLTAACDSDATTLTDIVKELHLARDSERSGRLIDHDTKGSMELKKREGYF